MNPYGTRYPWYQTPYNPHLYLPPQYNDPYHRNPTGWNFFERTRNTVERTQSKYPELNPALAADSTNIRYDLRKHPREGVLLSTYQQIALQPVLVQPTREMRIISKAFPWTVDIHAPTGTVVTCSAVFEAIHAMLQEPIVDSEWGIVVIEKTRKEVIEKAAKARQDKNKDARLKRIDWLGETTAFKGLERDEDFEKKRLLPGTKGCKETWVVKFGKP